MLERYREYLKFLDDRLEKMFEAQKPFIKCKKGCAFCCREGEYPISELEYVNLMFNYNFLDDNLKSKINENISNLLKKPHKKMYECPFLLDGICTVYEARAIICRTFGLLSYDKNKNKRIPFCVGINLNYANVFNEKTHTIKKYAEDGTEPVAYNITREVLRSSKVEKEYDIFFGEDKPLIEWLKEDFSSN